MGFLTPKQHHGWKKNKSAIINKPCKQQQKEKDTKPQNFQLWKSHLISGC